MNLKAIVMIGGCPDDWGFIPSFLDPFDPRPAAEQFDEHYLGGWLPSASRWMFDYESGLLTAYPDDTTYKPISAIMFNDEVILLYPHSWVLILQPDKSYEIARMD